MSSDDDDFELGKFENAKPILVRDGAHLWCDFGWYPDEGFALIGIDFCEVQTEYRIKTDNPEYNREAKEIIQITVLNFQVAYFHFSFGWMK